MTELGSDAFLLSHLPAFKRGRHSRIIEAPAPAQRTAREDLDVPLPLPVCADCREPIYYEKGGWHHRDTETVRNHEAAPEEISDLDLCRNGLHEMAGDNVLVTPGRGRSCRQCTAIRNRRSREKKALDKKPRA